MLSFLPLLSPLVGSTELLPILPHSTLYLMLGLQVLKSHLSNYNTGLLQAGIPDMLKQENSA
jgi:hypothetical protein